MWDDAISTLAKVLCVQENRENWIKTNGKHTQINDALLYSFDFKKINRPSCYRTYQLVNIHK